MRAPRETVSPLGHFGICLVITPVSLCAPAIILCICLFWHQQDHKVGENCKDRPACPQGACWFSFTGSRLLIQFDISGFRSGYFGCHEVTSLLGEILRLAGLDMH